MRLRLRLFNPASGRVDDLLLTAEAETAARDVAHVLAGVQPGKLFVDGSPLGRGDAPLGTCLHDGDLITVDQPLPQVTSPSPLLAVVGGPLSGKCYDLGSRAAVIGRSEKADVTLNDASVSREHAKLVLNGNTWTIEDIESRNGTYVDGVRVTAAVALTEGSVIAVGACLLAVRARTTPDADVQSDEAGGLAFNRPSRIRPSPWQGAVALPAKPAEPEPHPFPWLQVIAPIILASVAALIFRRPEAMLFALMSPIIAVSSNISTKRRDADRSEREGAKYQEQLAAAEERIRTAAARELSEARQLFPDAALLGAIATGPCRRLWERREHDLDAATLRVGVAIRPASISLTSRGGDEPPEAPALPYLPVTVDLARSGVLGIAGNSAVVRSVARWLVMQLATLRSPRDLQVILLTDKSTYPDWDWIRWLPHARWDEPELPLAMLGNDKPTREERVKELLKGLDARLAAAKEHHAELFTPSIVVVFDGVRALRSLPGVSRLLKEGPRVGIYAIGLDSDANRLAEEGKAELLVDPDDPTLGTLSVDGQDPVREVLLDQVDAAWADQVSRGLAPLRDTGGEEEESIIPDSVRYVDLAQIALDRTDDVVGRWTLGGRTTEALVGVSVDGPFSLDLKRDGPHALVAGTTGAGKSEFLQTLVVSLALANRPSAMNFVLVDYKGGSAFADCALLPHTVGTVTNLNGHLTERALVSLNAELKRRERELATISAPDVDVAWERDPDRAAAAGLARLVIVIDEFAELVQELPDFINGLIRVARVGRSLGVHLILATQRPAGAVSPEMRNNTGLRVALRVEDKDVSSEVLDAPHAAAISRSTPGRAYARIGGGTALAAFQTARVAGRRKGVTEGLPPPVVDLAPWSRLGYPLPLRPQDQQATEITDLSTLVSRIREAADELSLPKPKSPLLPPLSNVFILPHLSKRALKDVGPVVFGMEDLPADQQQHEAVYDVLNDSHLFIAGSARSGRSTCLRTIAASLARSISPSDLHLYGLDFGNGALLPISDLPHCGAVVVRSETERVVRLIDRLGDEVTRRQEQLAGSGFGDIQEQRENSSPEEAFPYLVLLLDRWEGFLGEFSVSSGSEVPDDILRLIREGPGVGLRLIITGDRSLLTDRMASQVEDKLLLRLNDRDDYGLGNINAKNVAEDMPPGRALRADSGSEIQIALLGEDPSAQAQARILRQIGKDAAERWPASKRHNRPLRVDVLPTKITFDQAWKLVPAVKRKAPLWALVGVGGDELTAFGVDLAHDGPGFVIGGPSKMGRSTALICMAKSLLAGGATIVALCPRPSPLERLAGEPGVAQVFTGVPDASKVVSALQEQEGPVAILVDDAETLSRTEADDALRNFLRASGSGRVAVVVAGQIDEMKSEIRGTIVEARKSKAGLLLSPESTLDGDLLAARLTRNLVGRMPVGRGIYFSRGKISAVQTLM